jgi:hypothetical protein
VSQRNIDEANAKKAAFEAAQKEKEKEPPAASFSSETTAEETKSKVPA